jgi:hypothetical protein
LDRLDKLDKLDRLDKLDIGFQFFSAIPEKNDFELIVQIQYPESST